MRIDDLMGKPVVGDGAMVLGQVCDVEIDEKTLRVTGICVKLNENAVEPMGFKKPRLGSIRVDLPVEVIKAIGDVVSIERSADQLGSVAKRR